MRTLVLLLVAASMIGPVQAQAPDDSLIRLTRPRFSYPTWSPDGQHILYESSASGNWEIYVMDLEGLDNDGGNVTQLTRDEALDRMPAWSPDGKHIVFVSDRDGDFEVFRMRADGSGQVQLTHNDQAEIHPYWSPDGKRIIFNRRVAGRPLYAVHMMSSDGTDEEQILLDDELNSYAQLSPDGSLIVFDKWYENNQENGEIYVMNADGTDLRRLTDNPDAYDGYPTWFPDSRTVLFSSEVEGVFKLFSIQVDGANLRQVTFGAGDDQRADVSPDGRKIVFNRTIDDNVNIHVLALD